jgi:hypothetical protein
VPCSTDGPVQHLVVTGGLSLPDVCTSTVLYGWADTTLGSPSWSFPYQMYVLVPCSRDGPVHHLVPKVGLFSQGDRVIRLDSPGR